jgi:transcriptional regulator with XRE-family HTH domain
MNKKELGSRIKSARKDKGWTQQQLAEASGLSKSSVSHIENGRSLPSVERLADLSGVLHVTTDLITTGKAPAKMSHDTQSMTMEEIATLCGAGKTTVRRWVDTACAKMAHLRAKMAHAFETKVAARFTLPETIAIIRAGGNETLADLLAQNANQGHKAPEPRESEGLSSRDKALIREIVSAIIPAITEAVNVKALPAPVSVRDSGRWLTRKEAADFLGMSNVTFAILMDQGKVKGHQLAEGTRAKYDRYELAKLLNEAED